MVRVTNNQCSVLGKEVMNFNVCESLLRTDTYNFKLLSLRQQIAGDDGALDFASAFVDGEDTGVAVHAFDFGFAGIAKGAMNLDSFVDHAIDHFAGIEFGAGGGGAHLAFRVFEEGGLVNESTGSFEFGVHVSEHPLDGLEFSDRFAESFPGVRVLDGFVECTLGQANGLGSDTDTSTIEGRECDFQAGAFVSQAICRRDHTIVEKNFHGGRAALAHFVFMSTNFEAREARFHEESGDSFPGRGGIGLREDDIDAGSGAIGDPGFRAVELVMLAVADGRGLDSSGVGACGRFG